MIKRLLSPKEVAEIDGVKKTTVYRRLARGEYDAVKDNRQTKITEESVARRREGLRKAEFGARRGVFGVPAKGAVS
jgi:excisionase family DNA binding protein